MVNFLLQKGVYQRVATQRFLSFFLKPEQKSQSVFGLFFPLNLDTRAPKNLGGSNSHLFFEALQFVIEERFFVLQTSQQTPSMLLFYAFLLAMLYS